MPPTKANNVWGATAPEGSIQWVDCPSGQTARAKRTGLTALVKAGVLAEGDALTSIVDKKHVRRVRGGKTADRDELDVMSLMTDPEQLGKVVMMVDRALPHIVVEPPVVMHFVDRPDGTTVRIPEEDRNKDVIYTDQIGLEDKMFLFDWSVGGTGGAERFRALADDAVAGVGDGEGVSRPAKRASRSKR